MVCGICGRLTSNKTPVQSSTTEQLSLPYQTTTNDNESLSDNENQYKSVKPIKVFNKTPLSYEIDNYGEDALKTVDLIVNGIIYRQIETEQYDSYNLKFELIDKDFGKFIGDIYELTEENNYDDKQFTVSSHEPNLKGGKAYYYAPVNCQALIIAIKDEYCSIFIADSFTEDIGSNYFEKVFEIFGIKKVENIMSVTCEIWKGEYDSTNTAITQELTITSRSKIQEIYNILLSKELAEKQKISITKPYSISISFNLTNGLITGEGGFSIWYMPYNSTGAIEPKGIIPSEQNEKLKKVFDIE